jgi:DNA polymerase-1
VTPGKQLLHTRTEDDVRARLGVHPTGVTTFKALAGDASDNIPGLPGVGPKTAVRLIDDYGTLEGMLEHLDELSPRIARILDTGREDARLFRQVATIVTDLDTGLDLARLPALRMGADDRPRALLNRSQNGSGDAEKTP